MKALAKPLSAKVGSSPLDPDFRVQASAHWPALVRVARGLLDQRDEHRAEDLVQEALTRALARQQEFRQDSSLFSWLCGILINVGRNERRRRERWAWLSLDWVLEGAPRQEPASPAAAPEADLVRAERRRAVRRAIDGLPESQRLALVLVSLEGQPVKEVARILDSSEAAVWQSLSRGRVRLKEVLRDL